MRNQFKQRSLFSQSQSGFTLIELMISGALGIMVIGGMFTLFSVNKESMRMMGNISQAQEKANFALEVMAEDIRMAGWPGVYDPAATSPFGVAANATNNLFDSDQRYDSLVVSRRGRAANPGNPDPLLAQIEMDCVGNPVPANLLLVHSYSVDANKDLICTSLPSGNSVVVVSDVEGFKVLYGVDTIAGPCASVNPILSTKDAAAECMTPTIYVNGDNLAATLAAAAITFADPSQLRPIKTIRLGIVVSTEETNVINPDLGLANSDFTLLGQDYEDGIQGADFTEGRALKYALRTIALRQALRGP